MKNCFISIYRYSSHAITRVAPSRHYELNWRKRNPSVSMVCMAASVLLKLYISGNERCHTTDAQTQALNTSCSKLNCLKQLKYNTYKYLTLDKNRPNFLWDILWLNITHGEPVNAVEGQQGRYLSGTVITCGGPGQRLRVYLSPKQTV